MKLLFVLALLSVALVSGAGYAYADVTIEAVIGSGAPGCEETADGCYTPDVETVDVGETIRFRNSDGAAHTFTSGHPSAGPSGIFDSSLVMSGNSFEWVPQTEGNQPYFCMVHPWMIGMIVVGEGSQTTPVIPSIPIINDPSDAENEQLRQEIMELKMENKQLKNKINLLNTEIDSLKDQIVLMSGEFVDMITQLNEWFRSQLS